MKHAAAAVGVAAAGCAPLSQSAERTTSAAKQSVRQFSQVIDLTHTLTEQFPSYGGTQSFSKKQLMSISKNGYYLNEWTILEHVGTHLDAPIHFSEDGTPADRIPSSQLVVPLAVIDIRSKAHGNPDAQLTLDDIKAYERTYGPIPEGACVAMNSGWDAHIGGDSFRNADEQGTMHFPGFHVEAVQYLSEERASAGIAVDTLSLDYGPSKDFAVHYYWLPQNRWGLEGIAKLSELPPAGATLVVGAPKVEGASGGLSRVFALV